MPDHVRPTKEELEKGIQKAQEEIEKLTSPSAPPTETEVTEDPESTKPPEEVTPPTEETPPATTPPVEETKPTEKTQEQTDKERLVEQRREALILNARDKKMKEALASANEMPEPTEDELKTEALLKGFTYDEMTPIERGLFKTAVHSDRRLARVTEVAKDGQDIDEWNTKVDEYADNPEVTVKYPKLEGKQDEFKLFASKPTRRGIEFETLVSAFLYEETAKKPVITKGPMFETPTGGGSDRPAPKKDNKISVEDSITLRQTNYKEWKKQLEAGNIANL